MFFSSAAEFEPAMRGPCIKEKAKFLKVAVVFGTTGVDSSRQVQKEEEEKEEEEGLS